MELTIFTLIMGGGVILNTILIYLNYKTLKIQENQINKIFNLMHSLDQKIYATEQNCVSYTTQTVKNTNSELEVLYKHVDVKMQELTTQIYKDFDIKKTQTNTY